MLMVPSPLVPHFHVQLVLRLTGTGRALRCATRTLMCGKLVLGLIITGVMP